MNCRFNPDRLWTLVLASGAGASSLQSTLTRARRWSAPERTIVLVAPEQELVSRRQLEGHGPIELVVQHGHQGAGPDVLLPISHILARDPGAHLVVLPAEQVVLDEEAFERAVWEAVYLAKDEVAAPLPEGGLSSGSMLVGSVQRIWTLACKHMPARASQLAA